MSRWRHSKLRGSGGQPAGLDIESAVVRDTVDQSPEVLEPQDVRIADSFLIIDGHQGDERSLDQATGNDRIRVKIVDAVKVLDKYAIPLNVGEKRADQLLKQHGESIVRSTLRAAIKERRQVA